MSTGNWVTVSDKAASSISNGRPWKRSSNLDSHLSKACGVMCDALGPSTSSSVLLHQTVYAKNIMRTKEVIHFVTSGGVKNKHPSVTKGKIEKKNGEGTSLRSIYIIYYSSKSLIQINQVQVIAYIKMIDNAVYFPPVPISPLNLFCPSLFPVSSLASLHLIYNLIVGMSWNFDKKISYPCSSTQLAGKLLFEDLRQTGKGWLQFQDLMSLIEFELG